MHHSTEPVAYLGALAPLLFAIVLLGVLAKLVRSWLPISLPWHLLGWLTGFLLLGAMVAEGARASPETTALVCLGASLAAYLVRRRVLGAAEREAREKRLEAARSNVRRRAPPPLPSSTAPPRTPPPSARAP